jgi:hypothetical protein
MRARAYPYAFTEQGVAMLSSVLRSKRAVEVNIAIMRTFVRLREMISSNKALARRLTALEKKYDGQFRVVFEARWEGHPRWSCAPGTRALRRASFDGRTQTNMVALPRKRNEQAWRDGKGVARRSFVLAERAR